MAAQNGIITAADAKHLGATTFDQYGHFKTYVNPLYPQGYATYWGGAYQTCLYSASLLNIFNKTNYNALTLNSQYLNTGFALPNDPTQARYPVQWNNSLFKFENSSMTYFYNSRNRYFNGVIYLNINNTGDYPICVGNQCWGGTYNQHATSYPINGMSFVTGLYLLMCFKNVASQWQYPYSSFYEILQGPPLFYQKCIELGTITYNNSN